MKVTVVHDQPTQDYFDRVAARLYTREQKHQGSGFVELINHLRPDTVLDVGCGAGVFLKLVHDVYPDCLLYGLDVSRGMLSRWSGAGSPVLASVWHPPLAPRSFDVVHLDALLHHLIGRTRDLSRSLCVEAVRRSAQLVDHLGYMLFAEPFCEPSGAGTSIFWMKKLLCALSSGRRLRGLGAPVTSFYTRAELRSILESTGMLIKDEYCQRWPLRWSTRWGALPAVARELFGFRWGRIMMIAQNR